MSAKTKEYWARHARNLVKSELARRGLNYADVAGRLKEIGINESPENIRNKINRGTFSALFLLQVLNAIGCKSVDMQVN
ncbi:MAG TPA: DUF6471 domain-containing protein [Acidiferrobacterales bacterium]|nr:DUF6471 domain-containing protein [Acidiferrobacterales bacterium]